LVGGPVGPASRWAATSNVEGGQATCTVNRERVWREGREWSEGQSHKEEEKEGGSGTGERAQGSLAREEGLYLDICAGALRVPSYATADGASLRTQPVPV